MQLGIRTPQKPLARVFNGTSDTVSVSLNLSAQSQVTVSFWLWQDTFVDNAQRCVFERGEGGAGGLALFATWDSTNDFMLERGAGKFAEWPRPSAAAWHHYLVVAPTASDPTVWVDNASQTLTRNDGNPGGNYTNGTAWFMSKSGSSRFDAGKLAVFAIWDSSVTLTAGQRTQLAAWTPPSQVQASGLLFQRLTF